MAVSIHRPKAINILVQRGKDQPIVSTKVETLSMRT
jgi:hypothetical protein